MRVKAQNSWSSLPSSFDWFAGLYRGSGLVSMRFPIAAARWTAVKLTKSITHIVPVLSGLMYETFTDHVVVGVVSGVVPIVDQLAKHGASLPPIVGWIGQEAGNSGSDLAVVCRIHGPQHLGDIFGSRFYRVWVRGIEFNGGGGEGAQVECQE